MRRILISLTVIALLFIPQFAAGDDLDDLKAADALGEKLTLSLDPNDAEAYANMFTDDFIYFDAGIPFPIMATKEEIKQNRASEVAQIEFVYWVQGNTIHRVKGDTGIVNKFGTMITKPKGKPEVINNVRFTLIFTKVKGKWLICAAHISKMPLGN